jgi:hypothetical protein
MWSQGRNQRIDATIGDGDINIIKLKYDEMRTTTFNCNINVFYLLYDITFLMWPPKLLLPNSLVASF